jgi:hypothetical protein
MIKTSTLACTIGLATALAIVGCGSSSTPSGSTSASPSSSASSSTSGSVDSCLVGNWTATGVSGSSTSGTVTYTFSGGGGDKVTIGSDGTTHVDSTNDQPQVGTGSDGSVVKAQSGGQGTGKITTSGNQLTFTIDAANAATLTIQTLDANGMPVGTPGPTGGFTAAYTCTQGQGFSFTVRGETTTFAAG